MYKQITVHYHYFKHSVKYFNVFVYTYKHCLSIHQVN